MIELHNPADMPDPVKIDRIEEPWIKATILVPDEYLGAVLKLCQDRRGVQLDLTYAGNARHGGLRPAAQRGGVRLLRPAEVGVAGYASFDYHITGYREDDLVKMSILVNAEPVDALSMMVHRDARRERGRAMCEKLKELIPRHMFKIPIQAAIGGKVIARETIARCART
jgi:GTP-binding protein LepA